jgi:hypothetical protein
MNARKLIGTIVLGAAMLVPVAQAQSPDDSGALRGPGAIAIQAAATSSHTRPDAADTLSPDEWEKVRGTVVVQPVSSGFDWGDALIGGLGGLGVALVLTGGFLLVASQRNKARLA